MSAITQIGNYARHLSQVQNLSNRQAAVDDLTKQLTTGRKSENLRALGPETQQLLDLRAELVRRDNYVQSIDTALPRLKGTDLVLNRLSQLASDWQSNNLMPFEPGPPSVTTPINVNPTGMKVTVNTDTSTFSHNARFTVTAIPSQTMGNGYFDVTVTDGLGGRSTLPIHLDRVPPHDGKGYNFRIAGGPGAGAVVNLSFDQLTSAGSSSFEVNFPEANQMKERAEGALRDIKQYLNERFGDRFLFSGSRFGTEPVRDLLQTRQTSVVTLNGAVVEEQDYFEVTVNGRIFSHQVSATDPKTITYVARQLTSQLNSASPALPVTFTTANGMITMVAHREDQPFEVSARVHNRTQVDNSVDAPVTQQAATATLPQIDRISLNGAGVDIGDTFEMKVIIGDPNDRYNLRYYSENPASPRDLPIYQEYVVRYTVTAQDFHSGAVTSVSNVADRLRTAINGLNPAPPVTANAATGLPILLTSTQTLDTTNHPNRTTLFASEVSVVNGSLINTVSVATLPPGAEPQTNPPYAGPPNLPFYDAEHFTATSNVRAWDRARVTADDGLTITYGAVSTDEAFQTLIKAFRMARAAAANPGSYQEFVNQSRELMSLAKDKVRGIQAKVSSDLATLESNKEMHKDAINNVTSRIAKIEGIDETEVAARLRTAMNAMEAAYTVVGQTKRLSLLNYLA